MWDRYFSCLVISKSDPSLLISWKSTCTNIWLREFIFLIINDPIKLILRSMQMKKCNRLPNLDFFFCSFHKNHILIIFTFVFYSQWNMKREYSVYQTSSISNSCASQQCWCPYAWPTIYLEFDQFFVIGNEVLCNMYPHHHCRWLGQITYIQWVSMNKLYKTVFKIA